MNWQKAGRRTLARMAVVMSYTGHVLVDLTTADRAVLIAIIAQLQATVLEQQRVRELGIGAVAAADCRTGRPGETGRPAPNARPQGEIGPEAPSAAGAPQAATPRLCPPASMLAEPSCPAVGPSAREVRVAPSSGGSYRARLYELSSLPTPLSAPSGNGRLGQQRLGVNLLSLIATLREVAKIIAVIQRYLDTVQLRLIVGAIVSAIHRTAQRAQPVVARIVDRIRASPVVHADETGWRQDGNNGYVWTFSSQGGGG